MEIRIDNLTEEQKEMLDFMWNEIDTFEDYEQWVACLSPEEQVQATVLQRLILLECMEEFLDDTTEASEYLKKFTLQ